MKRVGIAIAGLVVGATALGLGLWFYRGSVERDIADIRSRLVTEAELAHPDDPNTQSGIKLAPIQCERVYDLRSNPIARMLKRTELRALWRHCERIADMASGLDKVERKSPP